MITVDNMNNAFENTFLDDEQIASGTYVTSPQLEGTPHAHVVTLPTFSLAAYGLTLLASRQLRWTTNIPQTSIPSWIPNNLRQPLLNQSPTVTRANVDRLLPAKGTCTIYIKEFRGLIATVAFRIFRAAAILALYKYLSAVEHMQQNNTATSVDPLSQLTQALLQALDSVQPARDCKLDDRDNTVIFTPTEIKHNPLRQQGKQFVLILQDPRSIKNTINLSIRPPHI
jgi:hypothetical protein